MMKNDNIVIFYDVICIHVTLMEFFDVFDAISRNLNVNLFQITSKSTGICQFSQMTQINAFKSSKKFLFK